MVGIIIVNYCSEKDVLECVESLSASVCQDFRVYVIDNASPDGSGFALQEGLSGPRISITVLEKNIGFGGACNRGFDLVFSDGCDFALLLNPDTIVRPSMLGELLRASGGVRVSVPLTVYNDDPGRVWYAGGSFDLLGIPRHVGEGELLSSLELEDGSVSFASGCCMLIPRGVFERVGGFDEKFFLYWEDVDLSLRCADAGVEMVFVKSAKLLHKVSSSTGGEGSPLIYYYATRNRLYGIKKHHLPLSARAWAYLGLLRGIISRKPRYKYALQAFLDYRAGRMGMRPGLS